MRTSSKKTVRKTAKKKTTTVKTQPKRSYTPREKKVSNIQEFIVTKPVNWGYLKKTIMVGDVLTYDTDTDTVNHNGENYTRCQDFRIMLNAYGRNPTNSFMKPYNKNSVEAKGIIAKALAKRSMKKPGDFKMLPVEVSDNDLKEYINIADTQIGKLENIKREAQRKAEKEVKAGPMTQSVDNSISIDSLMPKASKDSARVSPSSTSLGTLRKSGSNGPVFTPPKRNK